MFWKTAKPIFSDKQVQLSTVFLDCIIFNEFFVNVVKNMDIKMPL